MTVTLPRSPKNQVSPKSHLKKSGSLRLRAQPKVGCLFSGMGGFATGFEKQGFEIVWANDNAPSAAETFRYRFPHVRFLEKDVVDLSVEVDDLEPVDVLTGGFPCQSFSQAGRKEGFADSRGEVFHEIPRLIHELGNTCHKPRLLVLENVANLRTGGYGHWFDIVRHSLRDAGYWFSESSCWEANTKEVTGLPQNRERIFLLAASQDDFQQNPFRPTELRRVSERPMSDFNDFVNRKKQGPDYTYLPESSRYHEILKTAIENGESPENPYLLRRSYVREGKGGVCPTLTASMGRGGHNVPFIKDRWGIRKLTPVEVATLQGFPADDDLFPDISNNAKYVLVGNSVSVPIVETIAGACYSILSKRDQNKRDENTTDK